MFSPTDSWVTPSPVDSPSTPHLTPPQIPQITESGNSSSFSRTLLIGLALVLLGTLLGVLAARFLPPMGSLTDPLYETPTPMVTEEISVTPIPTVEITPLPTPTATPSALLSLKWNMMTVKSPVTFFSTYKIYYPTTWSIKEYKNTTKTDDTGSSTLILTKGKASLNISQVAGGEHVCLFPNDPDQGGQTLRYGEFKAVSKGMISWRFAKVQSEDVQFNYATCESSTANSFVSPVSIGYVSIHGEDIDLETLDEINYMLEKIVIL